MSKSFSLTITVGSNVHARVIEFDRIVAYSRELARIQVRNEREGKKSLFIVDVRHNGKSYKNQFLKIYYRDLHQMREFMRGLEVILG